MLVLPVPRGRMHLEGVMLFYPGEEEAELPFLLFASVIPVNETLWRTHLETGL